MPMPPSSDRTVLVAVAVAVAVLAAAGLAVAAADPPLVPRLLTIGVGLTPLAFLATSRWRAGRVLAVVGGLTMVVVGVLVLVRIGVPALRLPPSSRLLLVDAHAAYPPVGLVLLGVAWSTTAVVAVQAGRRGLVVVAGWLGGMTAAGLALAVLAWPVYRLVRSDALELTAGQVAAAALGAAVAVVVPLLAHRTARFLPSRAGGPARPARHGLRLAVATGVLAVVAVAGVLVARPFVQREAFAEILPDGALAACVASAAGADGPSTGVTRSELAEVLSLDCSGSGIRDLTGIGTLTNLASLELRENEVSDLSPLVGLAKLGRLGLTHNEVSDLAPLTELPVLGDLGLSGNRVSDLGPLAGITTLHHLGLADNEVTDVTPLADLDLLGELDLSRNRVVDVGPLAGLDRLGRLTIADNHLSDPSPLGRLPVLTMLDVSRNEIAAPSLFTGFPELTELWVGANPVDDLAPLAELPSLTGVDISGLADATGRDVLESHGVYVGGGAK
ncbi:leucine-rich repeat domain-containing protein [Georgenia sp. MJ173]|uniref:leucine-rich repeat domain-containing protein n=1 Tax=Georgenia sunbinii TaxID=3117728 RepID=UPI002F266F15